MSFSISGRGSAKSVSRKRTTTISLLEYANQNRQLGRFNDVEIISGIVKCPANKMVLSCFSTVFEKMFTTEMKEKRAFSVKIESVDGNILKELINFIYTGTIDINTDNVCDLLSAAHFLQIEDVTQFCFEYLKSEIRPDNCLLILKIGDQYGSLDLTNAAKVCIGKHFHEVACSDHIINLSQEEILKFILHKPSRVRQTSTYNAAIRWIKHDVETRTIGLPCILEKLHLHKLPSQFLQDVVAKESLITNNLRCSNLLIEELCKQAYELKRELKQCGSRMISLEGGNTGSTVKEIFSCLNESPLKYPSLPYHVRFGCSEKLGDEIYYIGGKNILNATAVKSVRRMNLKESELNWKEETSLPAAYDCLVTTVFKNTIVATWANTDGSTNSGTLYLNVLTKSWKNLASLNYFRIFHSTVSCNNELYALGGYGCKTLQDEFLEVLTSVEKFYAKEDTWKEIKPMLTPRKHMCAVSHDGCIYAIGGLCGEELTTALRSVERFNVVENKWNYVSEMLFERSGCSACVLQEKIYVVGGMNADANFLEEVECYNPATDEWTVVIKIEDDLIGHDLLVI